VRNGHCLEACLDVWRPAAASACWEVQHSTLPWRLHPFVGSLQAKLHLCPKRQTLIPCLMISVSWTSLARGTTMSPFFGFFFGLWIIYMDPSFVHSYETVPESYRILPKSIQSSLWNKHSIMLLIIIVTFENLSPLSCLEYYRQGLCHIFSVYSGKWNEWHSLFLEFPLELVSQNVLLFQCSKLFLNLAIQF
jgi:hypothetical protein